MPDDIPKYICPCCEKELKCDVRVKDREQVFVIYCPHEPCWSDECNKGTEGRSYEEAIKKLDHNFHVECSKLGK